MTNTVVGSVRGDTGGDETVAAGSGAGDEMAGGVGAGETVAAGSGAGETVVGGSGTGVEGADMFNLNVVVGKKEGNIKVPLSHTTGVRSGV